jgi:glycosyltransferase involved in cell wall biosynthesis
MKITIVQGAFYPVPPLKGTSLEKFWHELGADLAERGHQVVHISRRYPSLPNQETARGVKHIRIRGFDSPKLHIVRIFLDLIYSCNALLSLPPGDVIVSNTFWFPILACLKSRRAGKLMVSVDRMPKGQYRFYGAANCFRVPSMAVWKAIQSESSVAGRKCVLIPNPLPFKTPNTPSLSDKQNIILFVGRIHPEKGIELLLEAFVLAQQNHLTNWRIRIVGPSDHAFGGGGKEWQQHLENFTRSKGSSVDWVGPIYDNDKLQAEFAQASIFVYPSKSGAGEALPLAPLEAMSQGVVPIVSNLDCFNDYISHGVNGLIFEQGPSAAINLAGALTLLANDHDLRRTMSESALRVRFTHSTERVAGMLDAAFRKMVYG